MLRTVRTACVCCGAFLLSLILVTPGWEGMVTARTLFVELVQVAGPSSSLHTAMTAWMCWRRPSSRSSPSWPAMRRALRSAWTCQPRWPRPSTRAWRPWRRAPLILSGAHMGQRLMQEECRAPMRDADRVNREHGLPYPMFSAWTCLPGWPCPLTPVQRLWICALQRRTGAHMGSILYMH